MEEGAEQLVVDWMDGQPAPEAVLNLLACKCPRKCVLPNCEFLKNGLKYTDMCRLRDCENRSYIYRDDDELENDYDY